jgi:hypothetical protein
MTVTFISLERIYSIRVSASRNEHPFEATVIRTLMRWAREVRGIEKSVV